MHLTVSQLTSRRMNIFKKPAVLSSNGKNLSNRTTHKEDKPMVLSVTPQQQREKFDELNELESNRIIEGLNDIDSIWTLLAAMKKSNKSRNRYSNVSPYDASRVILPVTDANAFSDYINASYMKLHCGEGTLSLRNDYIACQGPLPNTRNHFWAMCFHQSELQGNDTVIIAMVTPLIEQGMTKCDKYWPEQGETWDFTNINTQDGIIYRDLTITSISETPDPHQDYLLTELELTSGSKTKKVYHFYYYKWSDARVPPSTKPLANLSKHILEVKQMEPESNQPVPIVHCSAGVGRSGTFMVYDHLFKNKELFRELLDRKLRHKDLIYKTVSQLRAKRMMMVQTVYQYQFLYDVAKAIYEGNDDSEVVNSQK
ncbi:tyrosine protein phosphatase 1 [Lodderomyces elongisporus]|uniref:tyrosine protein phosphatase 1 n=1 Tax=Lodderomyces elongisporus TaxID=36914 RepID=UPI002924D71C|nr:tyrosine protein phosphatase 1 [Lodderomyces elongisporus]WLF78842.1 tyrosine protein phosphatase 1 [Lodderomyces elongisporus]